MSNSSLPRSPGTASPAAPCGGGSHARRSFFFWFIALVGAVAGLLAGLPAVGYFFGRRRQKIEWVTLGPVDRFAVGEMQLATFADPLRQPSGGAAVETAVYVRREEPGTDGEAKFLVLAIYCTHRGCEVDWAPDSGSFRCPCHGGVFNADGSRASGPPRRGLFHCAWRTRQQQLEIRPPHYLILARTWNDPSRSA